MKCNKVRIGCKLLFKKPEKSFYFNLDNVPQKKGSFNTDKVSFNIDKKRNLVISNGKYIEKIAITNNDFNNLSLIFLPVDGVLTLAGDKPEATLKERNDIESELDHELSFSVILTSEVEDECSETFYIN